MWGRSKEIEAMAARQQAVHTRILLSFLLLAFSALHAAANVTYQDAGSDGVDEGRTGSEPITQFYDWKVEYKNVTRLCHTRELVTVNGQFPGPSIYIREGDTVVVKVTNNVQRNITLHWHGVKQVLQNWEDGPAYVTQCPIQPGDTFTYNFTVPDQRGTVWWHAHITWLRATLHGAFIILPKKGVPYPFPRPDQERVLIFGEWWNIDTEVVEENAIRQGSGYTISNALTFNGQPGDLYNCSSQETSVVKVEAGKTYLLRLINAAMNYELYFSIAKHKLIVVEADGEYTKHYKAAVILLTPGQTTNVLLKASKSGGGRFYIASKVWSPAPVQSVPFPTVSATAILEYVKPEAGLRKKISKLPKFPASNDSRWALEFDEKIKSLASTEYPIDVPKTIDEDLLFTAGYNLLPCKPGDGCGILNGTFRLITSLNNVSFVAPQISLLQAYFNKINNVYTTDFPDDPLFAFNFTGPIPPANPIGQRGTKLNVLKFGANVQLVYQNTDIIFFESHPFHLHGFSFFVVGSGFGNFNATEDPKHFNLKDPPLRNTASVPAGGWTAIRWKANNPGVWFMHCHLEIHTSWGMSMAFIVQNGKGPLETLPPPPPGLPKC